MTHFHFKLTLTTSPFHLGTGILPRIMTIIINSCYEDDRTLPPRSCWFTTHLMQENYNDNCQHRKWKEFGRKIFYPNRVTSQRNGEWFHFALNSSFHIIPTSAPLSASTSANHQYICLQFRSTSSDHPYLLPIYHSKPHRHAHRAVCSRHHQHEQQNSSN
jgi:hypothetical protein